MSYVRCLNPKRLKQYPSEVVPVFGRPMPTTLVARTGRSLSQLLLIRLLIFAAIMRDCWKALPNSNSTTPGLFFQERIQAPVASPPPICPANVDRSTQLSSFLTMTVDHQEEQGIHSRHR